MKFVILTPSNVVMNVYGDIYNPTIYPDGERIVFDNGSIENIGKHYILVEDHIPITQGQVLDSFVREYDQSDRYIHMDFKERVTEVVEEVKEFFTGEEEGKGDKDAGS